MHVFKHPKYYKELRKRNKSDQVISLRAHDGECERAPGPGLKHQASSAKLQAFEPTCSSIKPQASSPEAQASSFKPQATSSVILEPRYMDIEKVFLGKGPRSFTQENFFSFLVPWF